MNNSTFSEEKQENAYSYSKILADELENQCEKDADAKTSTVYAPTPLQRDSIPGSAYPFDALGPIAGPAARRMHEIVQSPDATCGQSILAVLSLACQGFVDVFNDGRTHPTSLFMLTISESGERKSATDKIALKPVNEWQKTLVQQHKSLFTEYKNKYEIWKIKRTIAIKEAVEKLIDRDISIEDEPQPPCEGLMLCEEPTLEGLEQLLERGQPSAGIFSDEGGRLVGGHAMSADNALKTACGLSNLWDGKPLTRVRKSEGSKIHYGRRLSVHLMIQPVVLVELLNNEMLLGQGLLSRFLFSAPKPIAGSRKYKEVDLSKDPAILAFYDLVNKMLDRPYPKINDRIETNTPFFPADSLAPQHVVLGKDAKKRWIDFHDLTDSKMNEDGEFHPIKPFASKAAEQALRIAAIFAYCESLAMPEATISITLDQMERAITLVNYYLNEARRVLNRSVGDINIHLADQVLEWIKRHRPDKVFPLTDIYQRGPTQIRTAKKAKKMMEILKEHSYVIEIPGAEVDGKKIRSAWMLAKVDAIK